MSKATVSTWLILFRGEVGAPVFLERQAIAQENWKTQLRRKGKLGKSTKALGENCIVWVFKGNNLLPFNLKFCVKFHLTINPPFGPIFQMHCVFVLIPNTKRVCWGHILQQNIWNIAIGNWTKQRRVFFHRSIVGCSCQENALQRGDAWCSAKCILPFQWCHNCCNIELLTTCTSVKTDGYSFNATNVQRWVSLYVWALFRVNMFPTVTQNSKLDLFQNENNSKLKLCPIFAKKLFYFRFRASYQKTLHQYMVVTMLKAIWLAIWGHQQVVESNITFFAYWWWWWQWRRDICTTIHQRLKCNAFPTCLWPLCDFITQNVCFLLQLYASVSVMMFLEISPSQNKWGKDVSWNKWG